MEGSFAVFGKKDAALQAAIPAIMAEHFVGDDSVAWHEVVPGLRQKRLVYDEQRGLAVTLQEISPEADIGVHSHSDAIEMVYVLSGELIDHERVLQAGDFKVRVPGIRHSAKTTTGARVLLVFKKLAA